MFIDGSSFSTAALGLDYVRALPRWRWRVGALIAYPLMQEIGLQGGYGIGGRDIGALILAATGMGRREFWLWLPATTLAVPMRVERSLGGPHMAAMEIAAGWSAEFATGAQFWAQGTGEYAYRWSRSVAGARVLVAPSIPHDDLEAANGVRNPHTSPVSLQVFDRFVLGPVTIGIALLLGYGSITPSVDTAKETGELDWAVHLSIARSLRGAAR